MPKTAIKVGDLVCYPATGSPWRFGKIKIISRHNVELEYFDGSFVKVPASKVVLATEYFAEGGQLLSRLALCNAFYGQGLRRLSQIRVREIQTALLDGGLRFTPDRWLTPRSRIRIQCDNSFVPRETSEADEALAALLPRWLEPQKLPPSSRDPLGLQAPAERLANTLLPGLTVFTTRAGYYGFVTWAIQRVNSAPCPPRFSRRDRFNRLERALALCEFIVHGAHDDTCPLLGNRSKTQVLQSARNDRFTVPERILKNQNSAGAFRLYATSIVSFGLAIPAPELGVEGLLPFSLTELGERLARDFSRQVPEDFEAFAWSNHSEPRETLRQWGQRLCFSKIANNRTYRKDLLQGLLLGNSQEAETRYATIQSLFARGLLTGQYEDESNLGSSIEAAESEAVELEDAPELRGLGNDRVILHFYEEPSTSDNTLFQAAAVFELMSLGLSALFYVLVEELLAKGRVRTDELAKSLAHEPGLSDLWRVPMHEACKKARPVRWIIDKLLADEISPAKSAILGGTLLLRVLADPALRSVRTQLGDNAALMLVDSVLGSNPQSSLADAFPDLVAAMIQRHEQVSLNKNRQRWCFLEGNTVVKDDLQEMGLGFHALRFPQLHSLCRDLSLLAEDLKNGN